jgi:ABC-type transport system involved in cytochrome c biogenesis permease subunit
MEFGDQLTYAVLALYLAGTCGHIWGLIARAQRPRLVGGILSGVGFCLHGACLAFLLAQGQALASGEFYMSLFAWSVLLILFILWARLKLSFLALVATPLAMILLMGSLAVTSANVKLPKALAGLFFGLHIGTLFLSIALLAMACAAGVGYITLEKRIKTKEKLAGAWAILPSLDSLDRANRLAVMVGFPLYTVGLFAGFVWAGITWNRFFSWDPKEIVAVGIWLLFAFLFHQRLALGWRGRKPAWLAIWVFGLCLASMLVINFMIKTHHSLA